MLYLQEIQKRVMTKIIELVKSIVFLISIQFYLYKCFNLFPLGPNLHHEWYSTNNQRPPVLVTIIVVLCVSLLLNVLLTIRLLLSY